MFGGVERCKRLDAPSERIEAMDLPQGDGLQGDGGNEPMRKGIANRFYSI